MSKTIEEMLESGMSVGDIKAAVDREYSKRKNDLEKKAEQDKLLNAAADAIDAYFKSRKDIKINIKKDTIKKILQCDIDYDKFFNPWFF